MLGIEFFNWLTKSASHGGLDDFSDRLSFQYSSIVFAVFTTFISATQYFSTSITCILTNALEVRNFEEYMEKFCWSEGTINILPTERIPETEMEWENVKRNRKINYYQWIPFALSLQCILFYIPRLIWQMLYRVIKDVNLTQLNVESLRYALDIRYKNKFWKITSSLLLWYNVIKLIYLINCVGQLYFMQHFLGFTGSIPSFGYTLTNQIINGKDWQNIQMFPRVTYCYASDIRTLGSIQKVADQCVLPSNMLNEKIYIFLWYWVILVTIITATSIPIWNVIVLRNQRSFILQRLKQKKTRHISRFYNYIYTDGIFLLRMVSCNDGELSTSNLINNLWEDFNLNVDESSVFV